MASNVQHSDPKFHEIITSFDDGKIGKYCLYILGFSPLIFVYLFKISLFKK